MLGDELRKARLKQGLTQEALAFKARVDRTYISMLESDKKSPTLKTLQRICKALEVRPSKLLARLEERS